MVAHIENFYIDTLSAADSMLFMTGMEKSDQGHNKIYAMDALSGKTAWVFTLTAGGRGSTNVTPAYVDVEGILYCGGQRDDKLYALEARTGTLKREGSGMKDMYTRHPAVVGQMLYFVGGDTLYGMNVTKGIISWSYTLQGSAQTSSAVHRDIVYVIEKNVLHAVEAATGQRKWVKNVYTSAINYPIAYAGTIYIASEREVSALDAIDASVKWSAPLPAQSGDSTFSLADGVLYVVHWKDANGHGRLYALNADNGTELWHFDTEAEGASVPVVAKGVVYLAGWQSRKVFALDARTGDEVWSLGLPGLPGNQPVIAYGRLYVTVGGTIYAYGN
jgi:outer membrane protein assembly factor BamB